MARPQDISGHRSIVASIVRRRAELVCSLEREAPPVERPVGWPSRPRWACNRLGPAGEAPADPGPRLDPGRAAHPPRQAAQSIRPSLHTSRIFRTRRPAECDLRGGYGLYGGFWQPGLPGSSAEAGSSAQMGRWHTSGDCETTARADGTVTRHPAPKDRGRGTRSPGCAEHGPGRALQAPRRDFLLVTRAGELVRIGTF